MKTLVVAGGLFVLMGSCKKDTISSPNACTAANPLEEVAWLKQTKESLVCTDLYQYLIVKAIYRNQPVFYVNFSCPSCNYVFRATLLDCEGRAVRTFTSTEMQSFDKEVINRQVMYTCKP